jgi:hypothetical protein
MIKSALTMESEGRRSTYSKIRTPNFKPFPVILVVWCGPRDNNIWTKPHCINKHPLLTISITWKMCNYKVSYNNKGYPKRMDANYTLCTEVKQSGSLELYWLVLRVRAYWVVTGILVLLQ